MTLLVLALAAPFALGAALLLLDESPSRRVIAWAGVGASTVAGVLTAIAWAQEAVVDVPWLPALGLRLHLAVDGISGPLMLLTATVTALACATVLRRAPEGGSTATFVGCLLLTGAGALITFAARDAVLFFLAFELVLVPMWVLITRYGDSHRPADRAEAGARFVIFTGLGSTLMLLGILLLVARSGTADLVELATRHGAGLDLGTQVTVAALLTAGLAIKVPVWPLHSWLPAAHTTAPTAGSMLLAAVLLKMGTYGLVRLPLATVPEGFARVAPVLAVLGAVGIVWGGLVCLVERDLKRLVAWSSVAHMGFVVLALASGTATGVQAALYGNLAHGAISALLFLVVGGLKERWGDADLAVARLPLREFSPRLGLLLMVGLAAGLGLPGLAGFWGELFALVAAWSPAAGRPEGLFAFCAVVAAIGAALAAAYALRVARLVWMGDAVDPDTPRVAEADRAEADRTELVTGSVLAGLVVLLGVAPFLVLTATEPALATILGAR